MDPGERFEIGRRSSPLHAICELFQRLQLSILQNGKRFDDPIAQGFEKCRLEVADRSEHIAGEVAVLRALFGDDEIVDLAEPLPDLHELRGQQLPEERTNAYAREVIAAAANCCLAARVIAVPAMIKRLLHEPGK